MGASSILCLFATSTALCLSIFPLICVSRCQCYIGGSRVAEWDGSWKRHCSTFLGGDVSLILSHSAKTTHPKQPPLESGGRSRARQQPQIRRRALDCCCCCRHHCCCYHCLIHSFSMTEEVDWLRGPLLLPAPSLIVRKEQ